MYSVYCGSRIPTTSSWSTEDGRINGFSKLSICIKFSEVKRRTSKWRDAIIGRNVSPVCRSPSLHICLRSCAQHTKSIADHERNAFLRRNARATVVIYLYLFWNKSRSCGFGYYLFICFFLIVSLVARFDLFIKFNAEFTYRQVSQSRDERTMPVDTLFLIGFWRTACKHRENSLGRMHLKFYVVRLSLSELFRYNWLFDVYSI